VSCVGCTAAVCSADVVTAGVVVDQLYIHHGPYGIGSDPQTVCHRL
jgi:hypothetical protein